MDTQNISEQTTSETSIKKERSAAYPARTIEECLTIVDGINKNFRSSFGKREDILNIVEEVGHPRDIAAATYYTLLNRVKDTYQVSELYKSIAFPVTDQEKRKSLLLAFKAPKFNNELIEKFNGSELPKELIVHLHRFHGITEDAAPLAAEVFLKNAKYCGVLNNNNVLDINLSFNNDKGTSSNTNGHEDEPIVQPEVEVKQPEGKNEPVNGINHTPKGLIEAMVSAEETKIRLTGNRFATIKHPIKLSQKDIDIIKKHLEMLELLVE